MLVFRSPEGIPDAGLQAGDLVIVDPEDPEVPCAIYRPLATDRVMSVLRRLPELELLSDSSEWAALETPSGPGVDPQADRLASDRLARRLTRTLLSAR